MAEAWGKDVRSRGGTMGVKRSKFAVRTFKMEILLSSCILYLEEKRLMYKYSFEV